MGVSSASVSFVLNGKPGISESLRKSISQVLIREGYTVKPLSRGSEPEQPCTLPSRKILFVKFKKEGYFVENNGDYITKMLDGAEEAAKEFMAEILARYPKADCHIAPLSLSISCHIGPGSLAVTATRKLVEEHEKASEASV